jgi:hypothetical protein
VSGGVEKSASRRPQPNRPRFDPKIKFKKVENFQPLKKGSFSTTFYHAFHHVLTIKKPRSTPAFSQTPLKNTSKSAKIPRHFQRKIFL